MISPLDLANSPRDNLYAFGKTWGTFSEDPVVSTFHGAMYASIGTPRLTPLFGYAGTGITKVRFVGEGADETHADARQGDRLLLRPARPARSSSHWDNPFTGETVDVFHFLNDKIGGELTLEMPKLYVGDDPEHGVAHEREHRARRRRLAARSSSRGRCTATRCCSSGTTRTSTRTRVTPSA